MSTKDTLKLLKIQQIISNNIRQRYFNKGWLSMALFICKTAPSLRPTSPQGIRC
jgi:hypothetical protein